MKEILKNFEIQSIRLDCIGTGFQCSEQKSNIILCNNIILISEQVLMNLDVLYRKEK